MPEYFEDEEWRSQLYKWTSVAAKLDPEEYSYRMGWIYADGLGCDQSYEKAFEFFHQAYSHGDCRGADAIAKIYEEYLEENPDLDEYEKKLSYWVRLEGHQRYKLPILPIQGASVGNYRSVVLKVHFLSFSS